MKTNNVRHKLLAGEAAIGCFMGLGSPNVAELLTRAGLDWLVIETEHNSLDTAQIEHILMAVAGQRRHAHRARGLGAAGLHSARAGYRRHGRAGANGAQRGRGRGHRRGDALPACRAAQLRPRCAPRTTRWTTPTIWGAPNDNMLVALIVETREMLDNLEEVAAVPGVDVLFLGPFDLCLSLGLDPLQLPLPEIDAVLERMLAVGRKTGVSIGYAADTPEGLRALQAQGVTFISYGQDYGLLLRAIREGLQAFGKAPALD